MDGSSDDLFGSLIFGAKIHFHSDGSFEESEPSTVESPFQLHKPLPLCSFDREPVKIPLNHPLACSTPQHGCSEPCRSHHEQQQCRFVTESLAEKLATNMSKTAQFARETALDSRSLLNQSYNSMSYLSRSTMGQIQYIKGIMDGLEQRIDNEEHMCKGYWKQNDVGLQSCLHPSGHIYKLEGTVADIAGRASDHVTAADNIRRGYAACEATEKSLDQSEKHYTQICEVQLCPAPEFLRNDNIQAAAKLSTALFQVSEALSTLKILAPKAFRVIEEKNTLGNYMDKTLHRIRALEWAISRHFPPVLPGHTPVPSQSTVYSSDGGSSASASASLDSMFSGFSSASNGSGGRTAILPTSLSVLSLASTQLTATPWNLPVSPLVTKSAQSISSLLLLNTAIGSESAASTIGTAKEANSSASTYTVKEAVSSSASASQEPQKETKQSASSTAAPVLRSPRK